MTMLTVHEQQEAEQLQQQQQRAANNLAQIKEKKKERLVSNFKTRKASEDFQQRIIDFHRHRSVNAPLHQLPSLNGKPLDLNLLYATVTGLGGWERVCEKDRWDDVGRVLDADLFTSCTNAGHALKIIYIRYLSVYEKFDIHVNVTESLTKNPNATILNLLDTYSTSNPPLLANPALSHHSSYSALTSVTINQSLMNSTMGLIRDGSSSSRLQSASTATLDDKLEGDRRRFSYLLDAAPMTYNYNQHMLNTSQPHHSAYVNTGGRNPYEKLEIALESGLPNEVDFVFNTILLLSSDESHQFRIYASRRLIDLMLGHVGFFGAGDKHNFRYLYDNVWTAFDRSNDERDGSGATANLTEFLSHEDDDLSPMGDVIKRKFKREPSRNFVKFWHNVVQLPSEDAFTQRTSISKLLPKLYNNCKFDFFFHFLNLDSNFSTKKRDFGKGVKKRKLLQTKNRLDPYFM
jgi:hypothetical protein